MKNKVRDWQSMYGTYLKDYAQAEAKAYVAGGRGNYIRMSDRLTLNQFKTVYSAVENEEKEKRLRRIEAGKNPTKSINVLRKTIDTQKISAMSKGQAKAIKSSYQKTYEKKVSVHDLMIGTIDDIDERLESMWDEISDYYNEWKKHKGDPAWRTVGQVYFGSP